MNLSETVSPHAVSVSSVGIGSSRSGLAAVPGFSLPAPATTSLAANRDDNKYVSRRDP